MDELLSGPRGPRLSAYRRCGAGMCYWRLADRITELQRATRRDYIGVVLGSASFRADQWGLIHEASVEGFSLRQLSGCDIGFQVFLGYLFLLC
jgi:hypothetical protein